MFKERPAEIPVAPVRPKRASDAAAPFPQKLAGLRICSPPPINRRYFAERTDTDNVRKFVIRMPVYAADLKAGRAYNCGMPFDKEACGFDGSGNPRS